MLGFTNRSEEVGAFMGQRSSVRREVRVVETPRMLDRLVGVTLWILPMAYAIARLSGEFQFLRPANTGRGILCTLLAGALIAGWIDRRFRVGLSPDRSAHWMLTTGRVAAPMLFVLFVPSLIKEFGSYSGLEVALFSFGTLLVCAALYDKYSDAKLADTSVGSIAMLLDGAVLILVRFAAEDLDPGIMSMCLAGGAVTLALMKAGVEREWSVATLLAVVSIPSIVAAFLGCVALLFVGSTICSWHLAVIWPLAVAAERVGLHFIVAKNTERFASHEPDYGRAIQMGVGGLLLTAALGIQLGSGIIHRLF